jgi:hypothetical protein
MQYMKERTVVGVCSRQSPVAQKIKHFFHVIFWSWWAIINYKRVDSTVIIFPVETLYDIKMNNSLKNQVSNSSNVWQNGFFQHLQIWILWHSCIIISCCLICCSVDFFSEFSSITCHGYNFCMTMMSPLHVKTILSPTSKLLAWSNSKQCSGQFEICET